MVLYAYVVVLTQEHVMMPVGETFNSFSYSYTNAKKPPRITRQLYKILS